MTTIPVYDRNGAEVGTYEIDPRQLAPRINKQLLHDAVVMYQTNRRQGSAKTKGRSEVHASGRKMYRQKGTGRARAGSRVSNIRRGGGMTFAKRPRDWSYRLPKKALRLATRMAMASRIADNEVTLIDQLHFESPRTKDAAAVLKALRVDGMRLLVAVPEYDVNVYKSIRNLADVRVLPVSELNALEILRPRRLLMTTAALEAFRRRASQEEREEKEKQGG
ncbi:MAG TPA: 50S ribosomal protein L4 [Planctomycetaceae bacterium]|nr:50S ribosomal protein L4 [Planctomycetaceae bacterium]HIQ22385.1 50S ribosomal protein L4 [Planctomycetota bacterium]